MAIHLGTRKASKKYTFGLYRAEVIGALITVLIIWFVTGVLLYLACQRLVSGDFQVDPNPMIAVASCAVIFNIILGLLLNGQHHGHRCVFVWPSSLFTVFPHIRPKGIIFSYGLQLRVLLEIIKFHLYKSVPGAGIIRNAGII